MTTVFCSCECWKGRGIVGTANVHQIPPGERLSLLPSECSHCGATLVINVLGAEPVYLPAEKPPLTYRDRLAAIVEHAEVLRDEIGDDL